MPWVDVTDEENWSTTRFDVSACGACINTAYSEVSAALGDEYTWSGTRWVAPTHAGGTTSANEDCDDLYVESAVPALAYTGSTASLTGLRVTLEVATDFDTADFPTFSKLPMAAFGTDASSPVFVGAAGEELAGAYTTGFQVIVEVDEDGGYDIPALLGGITGLLFGPGPDGCGPLSKVIFDIVQIEVFQSAGVVWTNFVNASEV